LIFPFWSMVMLIWSKLQLDRWLENSLGRLNVELRGSLAAMPIGDVGVRSDATSSSREDGDEGEGRGATDRPGDQAGEDLLVGVEGAVVRLSGFVTEHQESFKKVWSKECRVMIQASTVFLWVSCVLAIGITAGMFWLYLRNHMEGAHRSSANHFAACMGVGLLVPAAIGISQGALCCTVPADGSQSDEFEDCIEAPPHLAVSLSGPPQTTAEERESGVLGRMVAAAVGAVSASRPASSSTSLAQPGRPTHLPNGDEDSGRLRMAGRRILQAVRRSGSAAAAVARRPPSLEDAAPPGGVGSPRCWAMRSSPESARPRLADGWARMDDEGGLCLAECSDSSRCTQAPSSSAASRPRPSDDKSAPLALSVDDVGDRLWMDVEV